AGNRRAPHPRHQSRSRAQGVREEIHFGRREALVGKSDPRRALARDPSQHPPAQSFPPEDPPPQGSLRPKALSARGGLSRARLAAAAPWFGLRWRGGASERGTRVFGGRAGWKGKGSGRAE